MNACPIIITVFAVAVQRVRDSRPFISPTLPAVHMCYIISNQEQASKAGCFYSSETPVRELWFLRRLANIEIYLIAYTKNGIEPMPANTL